MPFKKIIKGAARGFASGGVLGMAQEAVSALGGAAGPGQEFRNEMAVRAAEMDLERERMESSERLAQIDVNKVEAASKSGFVSGWRPAGGWSSLLVVLWIPALAWTLQVIFVAFNEYRDWPEMPVELMATAGAIFMGLAGLRTREKKVKVARD